MDGWDYSFGGGCIGSLKTAEILPAFVTRETLVLWAFRATLAATTKPNEVDSGHVIWFCQRYLIRAFAPFG
jgi:hypothetical protein